MKKRIIAWALALCLVLLPVPVTALAEEVPDFTGYYDVVSEVMDEVGFTNLKDYGKDWNRGLLRDLDGDGTKELLLNTYNGKNYRAEGFQLWTLQEGTPVLLLKGNPYTMSLYAYYLAEYQGEDFFVLHHSDGGSGAATDYYHFYKIGDPSDGEYKEIFYATDFYYYGGSHDYQINNIEANKEAFDKLADAVKNGTELKVEAEGTRLDDILDSAPTVEPGGLWFQQYGAYIKNHYENAEYKTGWNEDVWYYLLYIDNDDIPELWIRTMSAPFNSILLSCQDGKLVELIADADHMVYEERSGIFCLPLHRMGWGQDVVYQLSDGKITQLAKGTEEAKVDGKGQMIFDSDGYAVLNYFWEDASISKADYQKKLGSYVDPDKAIQCYPDVEHYSYTYMGQMFAHMADSLHSGSCGENVSWAFNPSSGILTISGSGEMYQYTYGTGEELPWKNIKDTIKAVVIEEGVTSIGWGAFSECANLESVKLPGTLTAVGMNAFSNCPKLSSVDMSACEKVPGGYGMFSDCDSLTSLDGFKLEYIPQSGFSDCGGFTVLNIPEGVTQIQSEAFSSCSNVREIIFPSSLKDIFHMAFYACNNVNVIRFNGDAPAVDENNRPFDGVEGEGATPPIKATAYYPAGNPTWTEEAKAAMGGELTWVAYCPAHIFENGKCTVCGEADPDWVEPTQPTEPAPTDPEPSEPEEETPRVAGDNRFETANLVADQMKENLGIEKFDAVVVASGTEFADALAGSYLAAVKKAPILLAYTTDTINAGVKDYIKANLNQGGTVYILGGTKAVPESFKDGLEDTFTVKRLAGGNRFETNLLVLEEAGVGDKPILVATGLTFADSLSASAAKLPILLVYGDKPLPEQEAFLNAHPGRELYVIGGEGAVNGRMEEALKGFGTVERVAGGNRFETSVLIAEKFFEDPESAVLAYAWDFPDGLCGGPLATTMNAPLILTMAKYEAKAAEYVQSKGIAGAVILGGEKLIPQTSIDTIFPRDTLHENELPIG